MMFIYFMLLVHFKERKFYFFSLSILCWSFEVKILDHTMFYAVQDDETLNDSSSGILLLNGKNNHNDIQAHAKTQHKRSAMSGCVCWFGFCLCLCLVNKIGCAVRTMPLDL